ncbi:MAG TPA: hypothetical protein VLA61_24705 [Ideonella sp.]|uniref:hypothetical protein n=1 Tax=Ideonella sp. TaxID=1929293 RepID=UPI002C0C4A08|nr:hypothetical protein [Ideonella sp.]HSI51482.1 hypothetical protein [Ideonella sp.]
MKVFIFGDSHTGSMRTAHKARKKAGLATADFEVEVQPLGRGDLFPKPFFADRGDHVEITEPGFRPRLDRLPIIGGGHDWYGLSGPFHSSRIWRKDWSAHAPWPLPGPGAVLSQSVVRQMIEDDLAQVLSFLEVLQRMGKVLVIESPAPFRHHRSVARSGADKLMLLHQRHRAYLMDELNRLGIPVIENDPSWLDADGFMLPAFRSVKAGDQHHGSEEYGLLMLDKLQAFVSSEAQAAEAAPRREDALAA